jgi:hypothetical protein
MYVFIYIIYYKCKAEVMAEAAQGSKSLKAALGLGDALAEPESLAPDIVPAAGLDMAELLAVELAESDLGPASAYMHDDDAVASLR